MKYLFVFLKHSILKPRIMYTYAKGKVLAKLFHKRLLRGLDIAVTYQCPAQCAKCSVKNIIDENRRELTVDELEQILDKSIKIGAIHVNLTGGEPALRKDIVEIVERLSKKPVVVSLAACGYTMTDELLEKLKAAGLGAMQISIASTVEAEHDRETGLQGSHRKALHVLKKARELGIDVLINTVATREKLRSDRIAKLVDLAKAHRCFLCFIIPAELGGWEGGNRAIDLEDFEIIKKWLRSPYTTSELETNYGTWLCPAGSEKIYISAYGDLYPCPHLHTRYGNVLEDDLAYLWRKMNNEIGCRAHEGCLNVRQTRG